MKESPSNQTKNHIPSSIDEADLIRAIQVSGYPLQGVVASKLNNQFGVTEEWGYIDRDTQEHRSLDVFAYKPLLEDNGAQVQPSLALLIECKRTIHPYIFFKSVTDRAISHFPSIAGLVRNQVLIQEPNQKRALNVSGSLALGRDKLPFVESGPPKCASFTKAIPSGKKVELSGADPFKAASNNSFNPTGISLLFIVNLSVPQMLPGGLIRALDAWLNNPT